jgi:hypothetical protein
MPAIGAKPNFFHRTKAKATEHKKTTAAIVVGTVAVLGGGYYLYNKDSDDKNA